MASYFFNGGSRPYTKSGGNIYGFLPVKKSIFKGGWGIWEAVLRYSTFDLADGAVKRGKVLESNTEGQMVSFAIFKILDGLWLW